MASIQKNQTSHTEPNFIALFEKRVSDFGHATAARRRIQNSWEAISWREWWLEAERFGTALIECGLEPYDRIAVISDTRFEWLVAEVGSMMSRTPSLAIFPAIVPQNLELILHDAKPRLVVLEDPSQLEKLLRCDGSSHVETVVLLDRIATFMEPDQNGRTLVDLDDLDTSRWPGEVIMYDAFMAMGRRALAKSSNEIARRRLEIRPDDAAAIVFTSGTTSVHRGVVITHKNIVAQSTAMSELELFRSGDMHLLALPLSHIFAKLMLWTSIVVGVETAIGTGLRTIVRDATEIQPNVIATVPSLLEHFRRGIRRDLRRYGSLREKALDSIWSAGISFSVVDDLRRRIGGQLTRNVLERMFGTRLRLFISGGAKTDPELAEFFERIGLGVVEGYGLTETTGFVAVGRPDNKLVGTVGFPVPGVDVTLDERGEIWVRGAAVSKGYFTQDDVVPLNNEEGWFQTGDIGAFDDRGRLQVLGRLSDEIVTSGGRKVSPRAVELELEHSPHIQRAFVSGDGRPYVVALLVVDEDTEAVRTEIEAHVQAVNDTIATTPTIRRFECISEVFSVERGEITETGKLRRGAILRTHHRLFEHMYR